MLHRIGFMMGVISDAIGVENLVDRFGMWLYWSGRLPALEQGIHDAIMKDLDRF